MIKRIFDFFISFTAFFFLIPIMVIIAWGIRTNLGSPVLFRQLRPGLLGKPFYLVKFRSMRDETSKLSGELLPDSERLTSFGQILRSLSLDELPEFWNVLKGEMSLVGPRPLLMEYLSLYSPEQARRHKVRPGITGWAQVSGRNAISWDEKFKLDVWYIDNQSFWLDIKILFLTVKKVLTRDGVSAKGEATMAKFTGSQK